MKRHAEIGRTTGETDVFAVCALDGGKIEVNTGIPFFDHMLVAFATHGGFGLTVRAKGDLEVDGHHTVEDTGIVMGQTFLKALGEKEGIARFGSFFVPMDEALAFAAVDVSGRPFLRFDAAFIESMVGAFDTALVEEFWRAFAMNARITLHMRVEYGQNAHHKIEALFKAVAHALRLAVQETGKREPLSTKGMIG